MTTFNQMHNDYLDPDLHGDEECELVPMKIELYEDNAGGLFLVPVGGEDMIQVYEDDGFLADCKGLHDGSWDPDDRWAKDTDGMTLIASRDSEDPERVSMTYSSQGIPVAGVAGREYLEMWGSGA